MERSSQILNKLSSNLRLWCKYLEQNVILSSAVFSCIVVSIFHFLSLNFLLNSVAKLRSNSKRTHLQNHPYIHCKWNPLYKVQCCTKPVPYLEVFITLVLTSWRGFNSYGCYVCTLSAIAKWNESHNVLKWPHAMIMSYYFYCNRRYQFQCIAVLFVETFEFNFHRN